MTDIEVNGAKIRKHLVYLANYTQNLGGLLRIFYQHEILNYYEKQDIFYEKKNVDRAALMYLLLSEKVTDSVFKSVLQALRDTGNTHASYKLEYLKEIQNDAEDVATTAMSRTEREIAAAIADVHIDKKCYALLGLHNEYLKLKDSKIDNPWSLTKIHFTFFTFSCQDIVEGLQECRQLQSLLLENVDISENEYLDPENNDSGQPRRVHLPQLNEFVWKVGKGTILEPSEAYINSWIFFYKTENEKSWVLKDIESLEMEIFKINYSHASQCFFEINRSEASFRYGLEENVDSILTSLRYSIKILELWNCRVSLNTLPINMVLKELTLRDLTFEDKIILEMDTAWFEHHQEMTSLHVSSIYKSPIVLDLFSLPPNMERLKLMRVGVKPSRWFCTENLSELVLCGVSFFNKQYEIAPSSNLTLNWLKKLKTLNISPLYSNRVTVDLNSLQENVTTLRLCETHIPKARDMNYLRFAQNLVDLELKGVTFVLKGRERETTYLYWLNQFTNLKKLKVCSLLTHEVAVHLNSLPSQLTNLILHHIQLLLLDTDQVVPPFAGIQFGSHLMELEFVHCRFTINRSEFMPKTPLWFNTFFKKDFKNWLAQRCPQAPLRLDSAGWLRFCSTPPVGEIMAEENGIKPLEPVVCV